MSQELKELKFISSEMGVLRLIEISNIASPNSINSKYAVMFIPHSKEIESHHYYEGDCEVIAREIFEREAKEWAKLEDIVNETKYSLDGQDFEPFELKEQNNVIHVDFVNKVRLS